MLYLITLTWWKYVLDDSRADKQYGPWDDSFIWRGDYVRNPVATVVNYISRFLCRWRGHPAGLVWYNVGGLEPNMHCNGCGEDLG